MSQQATPAVAMNALRRVVRGLRLAARTAERTYGVTAAQLFVLHQLVARDGCSLGELAALTETDPSSVSVVVSRLVSRRLVARRTDSGDARRAVLTLTARGRALVGRAPEPAQARLIAALQRFPRARLAALTKGLETLAEALGAVPDVEPMFFEDEGGR
jgi:DNA-binding MarR family transcriptional regulator